MKLFAKYLCPVSSCALYPVVNLQEKGKSMIFDVRIFSFPVDHVSYSLRHRPRSAMSNLHTAYWISIPTKCSREAINCCVRLKNLRETSRDCGPVCCTFTRVVVRHLDIQGLPVFHKLWSAIASRNLSQPCPRFGDLKSKGQTAKP